MTAAVIVAVGILCFAIGAWVGVLMVGAAEESYAAEQDRRSNR